MSSFSEPLLAEITQRDKRPITVAKEFTYRVKDNQDLPVTVEAGFKTDGATVPRPFTAFIPPLGRHGKAAILHDWLYRWPDWEKKWNVYLPESKDARHAADMILLEAMAVLEVPVHRRLAIYAAVRVFGWIAWEWIHDGKFNHYH